MTPLETAQQRINECRETRSTKLDLSKLSLDDIPDEVFELIWLKSLDVSGNIFGRGKIKGIPSRIKKLTMLVSLSCGNSQISELPPLSSLTALTFLDCSENRISDLSPLIGLTALVRFDCFDNQISDLLPLNGLNALSTIQCWNNQIHDLSPLSELNLLSSLDCSENPIKNLLPLRRLTMLTSLSCSRCLITKLSPLRRLTALVRLDCSENTINNLRPLSGLTALSWLDCSANKIKDLLHLSGLTALSYLDCRENTISDLLPLSGLAALNRLDCSENIINDLRPLSGLTALSWLDCSENTIDNLLPLSELASLASLGCIKNRIYDLSPLYNLIITEQVRYLYVQKNPIHSIPSVILLDNCVTSLRTYWAGIAEGAEQRNQLKVQLVGNGRVGKTTLADALDKKRAPDEDFESTHGITIKDIPLALEGINEPVTLQLWDFGGQEIYHSTHRLFLSDDCLYLLLWAEKTEEHLDETRHPLTYWLESINDLGANSPIILIKNQIDLVDFSPERPPELTDNLPGVRQIYQSLKISAFKYLRMNTLRGAIKDIISELRHEVFLKLPCSWIRVEAALGKLKEKQKTIPFAHFKQLCIKEGVSYPVWLASYLDKTGVFFYREGAFQNQIILDQNWAIEAVYKLFDPKESRPLVTQMQGTFKGSFTSFFWPKDGLIEREIYLDFMRNCGICYEPNHYQNNIDEKPFVERQFIIPALLPEDCSAASAWQKTDSDWQFEIKYTFLHRSIIDRIIMVMGEAYYGTAWRNGIFCETENGKFLLECTYANREISNRGKLTFHLRGKHLENEKMIVVLRKLVKNVSPHDRYQENLRKSRNDESQQLPKLKKLDDTEYLLEEKSTVNKTVKLFISYSHSDETPYRIELDKRLKAIRRKFSELQPWHDRSLLAGEKVHDKILQQLEEADIVVLLISPDFMDSDYCFSHEMEVALKQYEENKNIVIPVIIRTTADWSDFQIGNHTALPTDGKPLAKWDDQDEFWADVQTGISKQVERLVKR